MSNRMNAMFNHVNACIAWPGGLGTLEEIFHISSWAQLHIHHKSIGLLNVNGFYDNLLSFLDHAVEQKFLTSSARQIIISATTAKQLIDQLQSFISVIDPSMSLINWSTKESRKKLRLDLSLRLWNLVSFGFINSILFYFVISYICLSVF
jgi:predicted Rossmann-fold nucleotide-binding protein